MRFTGCRAAIKSGSEKTLSSGQGGERLEHQVRLDENLMLPLRLVNGRLGRIWRSLLLELPHSSNRDFRARVEEAMTV